MDHVDKIKQQWNHERPDLDVGPMEVIGRFKRVERHLAQGMGETFSDFGLNAASFDVLATLRRSGAPYRLSPGDLMKTTMVTSGTMTNRIDQLVKAGLVERIVNEEDGRSFLIALTKKGFGLIDDAMQRHVDTQARLLAGLSKSDRATLNALLRKLLVGFEGE